MSTKFNELEFSAWLSLMGNYNYFTVQQDDKPPFYSTGINRSCGRVLEFERKFATPVYSDGEVTEITAISPTTFKCQIGEHVYNICAIHEKPKILPAYETKTWDNILDFVDTKYINSKTIQYIEELGLVILVVEPDLLGKLTPVDEARIKWFLDVYLHGQRKPLQMCRTLCFECDIHSGRQAIYTGIYDLENNVPLNKVMVYNKLLARSMPDKEVEKYMGLWGLAWKAYSELTGEKNEY